METYNEMVQRVEAVKDTFKPEVYEIVTNTLEALEILCKKRDAANGSKYFMNEPIEVLVMYLIALIKKPNAMPLIHIQNTY